MSRSMPSRFEDDTALAVRDFLLAHPDFFCRFPDALGALEISHDSGDAISLIERQVNVLRDRCRLLEARLCDLVANAQHNERLNRRLHRLVQEIISADSLGDVIALTSDCLQQHFRADSVYVVMLAGEPHRLDDLPADVSVVIEPDDARLEPFDACFESGCTRCGEVDAALAALIPASCDWSARSAAVVPLTSRERYGLLVLGSDDPERFGGDAGVMFLDQLGDVLGRRLATLPIAI